jgi:hypothetical protein
VLGYGLRRQDDLEPHSGQILATSPRGRKVGRTPGISCEAVPASNVGRRGHEAALRPSNGAAESFVSFIPLLGRLVDLLRLLATLALDAVRVASCNPAAYASPRR